MKKKLLLIVVPLLFLICFSSTASALSTEEGIGVDSPGLYTYVERFADLSGALTVTTTGVNNSGSDYMYITVVVICMDAEQNFRLRIFDSDEDMFLEIDNENGIGAKERRWTVRPHMDKEHLIWTASVTDLSGEVIYAQLSLLYTYDESSWWRPPGDEDEESMSEEKHKQEILYTNLSYLVTIPFMIIFTGVIVIQREGTGVKHFIKSKIKEDQK
jgi:hypothetical protein